MRLEKIQEEEAAKRKGLAGRAFFQFVWLGVTGVVAYILMSFIFGQNAGLYNVLYSQFSIPRAVPAAVIFWAIIVIIVLLMQLVFVLGFLIASPEGRRRPGEPSLYSRNPEPFDDRY